MKNLKYTWHKNLGFCEKVCFRPHERSLILKMFRLSLDAEIKKSKKTNWIEVEAKWRNVGSK